MRGELSCQRRLTHCAEEALVLGGGDVEHPRGLGVHPVGVSRPFGDVDDRACGGG